MSEWEWDQANEKRLQGAYDHFHRPKLRLRLKDISYMVLHPGNVMRMARFGILVAGSYGLDVIDRRDEI